MVQYRRNFVAGGTYLLTLALADRRSGILVDRIEALRAAVRSTRRAHPFSIDAIVVLPDHLHVVMTLPENDTRFSIRWSLIKRRFTDAAAREGPLPRHPNAEPAVWQRRFWEHTIRDDRDFECHVDYIHFNPVKHGLVTRVSDWPHSSFHQFVRRGILPEDWAGDAALGAGSFGEP
jgi:putative transposase